MNLQDCVKDTETHGTFAENAVADIEGTDVAAEDTSQIVLYQLRWIEGKPNIVRLPTLEFTEVCGACQIPDGRLALTHRDAGRLNSFLAIVDRLGNTAINLPLYSAPKEATRRYNLGATTIGDFLSRCRPAALHKKYGVLLCDFDGQNKLYQCGILLRSDIAKFDAMAVYPDRDVTPQELPAPMSRLIDWADSMTTREQIVSLSDERTLFVFSEGAVILGDDPFNSASIGRGAGPRMTVEILSTQSDGSVLICNGYVNPDNEWSRDGYRFAVPPFSLNEQPRDVSADLLRITQDGSELSGSAEGSLLQAYPNWRGNPVKCWARLRGHLALAYPSGRIEIRSERELDRVVAIGYTTAEPNAIAVLIRQEGTFLVVSAGDLVWFDISNAVSGKPFR